MKDIPITEPEKFHFRLNNIMNNKFKIILSRFGYFEAAVFIFFFSNIFSQSQIRVLHGKLLDLEYNTPVEYATVSIIELNKITVSNDSGYFSFANIPDDIYTFKFQHISYKEKLIKVDLRGKKYSELLFFLEPKSVEISTVTISDFSSVNSYEDLLETSNVLKGKELQKELGLTLASTLKNETGIALRSMGSAPSRPVIRGFGSDRVIISEDGVKATDLSATSPDHAVTIEPFSSDRIEIIRGAKLLTHSSSVYGGLINVIKNEIPTQIHDEVYGTAGIYYESSNNGFMPSVTTEIPFSPLTSRFEFSQHKSSNLYTPEGTLTNSYSENQTYSGGISFFYEPAMIGTSYRNYELNYGIPGGFVGAHPFGVDISLYRKQLNLLSKINFHNSFFENLTINSSFVKYRHKEFEKSGRIGSEFRILNNLAKVELKNGNYKFINNGILGVSFEKRDFDIGGFVFTSPTISTNFSAYLFESMNFNKFIVESAFRLSFDFINPKEKAHLSKIGFIEEKKFSNYSFGISFVYPLTDIVHIGTNISKSSRVPTIEGLFSEGPHLAAYSYEIGNPYLSSEEGMSYEIFVYHKFKKLYYNINFFLNDISNFIIPRNSGEINYATFLPIYKTQGVDARIFGFEYQIEWNFWRKLFLANNFSLTRGIFKKNNNPLPQIPPAKGIFSIMYRDDDLNFGLKSDFAFAQNFVDDFETPTKGYLIFGLFAQYSFQFYRQVNTVSLQIENITNQIYRNHLSRVKIILPESGINLRLVYKMYLHV